MTDYLVTFQDGSQRLAHHGVKGMHWGEWNDETRQKYLGGTGSSAKGDRLRKKAQKQRDAAARTRTDTARVNAAARAHTNEITEHYAKASAHRAKAQVADAKASRYKAKAERAEAKGKEGKAKRMERKAQGQEHKAEMRRTEAKKEADLGHVSANKLTREQKARAELDAVAKKAESKAKKYEKKAAKVDAKQAKREEKAFKQVQETAKSYHDEKDPREKEILKGELNKASSKLLSTSQGHRFARSMIESIAPTEKRAAQVQKIMDVAIKDTKPSKKASTAVDAALKRAS